jgi:predicted nucleic acid-binding protein
MDKVLIDTDVILDFFFDREPFSREAAQIISLCEAKKVKGFITPVICSNVYYILRQVAKHEKVIEKITQLIEIIDVLPMDREIVIQALKSGFKDFEDALQNFSAVKSKNVSVIITRNVKDYSSSEIGVFTPGEYLGMRDEL